MRVLLVLASLAMLASAEPPTGYSHRSSNSDLNFQPVPSVAQIHIPPSSQTHSQQYVMPSSFSTLEKQYAGPQVVYSPSHSHYSSRSSQVQPQQQTSSSNQLQQYSPAPQQYASASSQQNQYSAPSQQYSSSSSQQQQYSAPSQQQQSYSAPSQQEQQYSSSQQQSYAAPQQQQQQQYSSPSQSQQQYSAPPQQYSSPTNVQVSYGAPQGLPQGASYGPPPVVTGAGPDHNVEYRVVYVKGPKAPKPDLILPPPPPQQKTLVYILVPKVEPPEPIIVPTHPPTPPSKPEVFFIRYKAPKKARQQQSYSSLSSGYGSPVGAASGESPVVVEAPKSDSPSTKILVRKSSSESSSYGDKVTSGQS